jgi:hypothetical protein
MSGGFGIWAASYVSDGTKYRDGENSVGGQGKEGVVEGHFSNGGGE